MSKPNSAQSQSQYRQIFKATSLFGGVQVFNILISVIRGKAVAFLIGPTGMGLYGLLNSSITLITSLTDLGLPQAAVRDISAATSDPERQKRVYAVFRQWIWLSALLGLLVTFIGAPLWSRYIFDSEEYTWAYRLLSLTFVFTALTGGVYTALRGTRKLKALASATMINALLGLLVALPFYYFMGISGVVPALFAIAAVNLLVALYFKRKVLEIPKLKMAWRSAFEEGLPMVKLGLSMSTAVILTNAAGVLTLSFINHFGAIADVGLYAAAKTITLSYVGMIFMAMATDYYPRLSAAYERKEEWPRIVEQQTELILLILGPIVFLLIASAPWLIRLLLSAEFSASADYVVAAALGMFLKAPVWALGYVIIASGRRALFLQIELAMIVLQFVLGIAGYYFQGLLGLGLGFSAGFMVSILLQSVVLKAQYQFQFGAKIIFYLLGGSLLLAGAVAAFLLLGYEQIYLLLWLLAGAVSLLALYRLNQILDIKALITKFLTK